MSSSAAPPSSVPTGTFLGHPKGLFLLFFTEMWERFSYYGMRSLLVLYMVNHLFVQPDVGQRVLGFNAMRGALESFFGPMAVQPLSSQIYGLYTAFVYLTPFFGGMLADKVLGQRRAVVLGGILMAIGHFLMASEQMFLLALMFLILGNGAFKPNISTQVGSLYPEGDPRRDGAFTIFYMGINLGAFFSPLVCGTLGQTLGWHWGFGAAGVGMVIGLVLYLWGQPLLGRAPAPAQGNLGKAVTSIAVYIGGIVLALLALVIALPRILSVIPAAPRLIVLSVVAVALIVMFVRWLSTMPRGEAFSVGSLVVLCALNIVFWGVYEQQGNTMQLWADKNTNWNFFGFKVPSTWYQSFNPLMIFAFAPLLTMFWARQGSKQPSSVAKMGYGCVMLGLSYIIMVVAAHGMAPDALRSVLWLVFYTVILTVGELYLSPIGLSFVTKVAPVRMVSMLMGVWFLSSFFGNYLAGYLGTFWEKMSHEQFFMLLTGLGVASGVLFFVFSPLLEKHTAHHDRPSAAPAIQPEPAVTRS